MSADVFYKAMCESEDKQKTLFDIIQQRCPLRLESSMGGILTFKGEEDDTIITLKISYDENRVLTYLDVGANVENVGSQHYGGYSNFSVNSPGELEHLFKALDSLDGYSIIPLSYKNRYGESCLSLPENIKNYVIAVNNILGNKIAPAVRMIPICEKYGYDGNQIFFDYFDCSYELRLIVDWKTDGNILKTVMNIDFSQEPYEIPQFWLSDTGGNITPKMRLYANPISGKVSAINQYGSKCEPLAYLTEDISESIREDVKRYLDDGYQIRNSRVLRRLKGDNDFKGFITLEKDDDIKVAEVRGTTFSILENDLISLFFRDQNGEYQISPKSLG